MIIWSLLLKLSKRAAWGVVHVSCWCSIRVMEPLTSWQSNGNKINNCPCFKDRLTGGWASPTATWMASSSWSSRFKQAWGVSPASIFPPGNSHWLAWVCWGPRWTKRRVEPCQRRPQVTWRGGWINGVVVNWIKNEVVGWYLLSWKIERLSMVRRNRI